LAWRGVPRLHGFDETGRSWLRLFSYRVWGRADLPQSGSCGFRL